MPDDTHIMGLFENEDQAVDTVRQIQSNADWAITRVNSPLPSRKLAQALSVKKSLIGWCTLAGGITGFFSGFLLAAFTSARWGLIVSGKPVVALVPFSSWASSSPSCSPFSATSSAWWRRRGSRTTKCSCITTNAARAAIMAFWPPVRLNTRTV